MVKPVVVLYTRAVGCMFTQLITMHMKHNQALWCFTVHTVCIYLCKWLSCPCMNRKFPT